MGWVGRYRGVLVGSEVSHQHPLGASWGPPHRFNMGDMTGQYEILKTPVFTGISTFSRHRWRFALSSLGPNFGTRCPHAGKLRTLSPTCVQTCPRCAMLDPSWAKLEPTTGPSSGQVRPKFGPSGLLFGPTHGQGRPSLTPVGFGWAKSARSYLSISIPWARAVLVAKRLELF